jgi:hypothetical protein
MRRVPLALRRGSPRPAMDRMALDFRPSRWRPVPRVSRGNVLRVFVRAPFYRQARGPVPVRGQVSRCPQDFL